MKARTVVLATALAAGLLVTAAPSGQAHSGGSFCEGTFVHTGHGEGHCETAFQGFPAGVIGLYDAGDPEAPAEIHVEAFAVTANGSRFKLAECAAEGNGTATCEAEKSEIGQPLTIPEPLPTEIVRVECAAHSHAEVVPETEPVARFGCYTTDEAEAEMRDDMGVPPADDGGEEPPPDGDEPSEPPALALGQVITTVPRDTYAPPALAVTRAGDLTYLNMDANRHDVVARTAKRPDGSAPWCGDFGGGQCPLFWSELIQGPGTSTPVLGLADTKVGTTYEFYCSIHPYMSGTLTVVG